MAETKTYTTHTTAPRTHTEQRIQWGTVIKGVAIVAAVAVAAVVAYQFIAPVVGTWIADTGWASAIVEGVKAAAIGIGEFALNAARFIGGGIADIFGGIFPGIAGAARDGAITGSGGALGGMVVGGVAAGGVALLGLPIIKSAFSAPLIAPEAVHTQSHTDRVVNTTPDRKPPTPDHGHDAVTTAQTQELASHASASTWAERVPQADRRAIAPRAESHAAQIHEEQARAATAEPAL